MRALVLFTLVLVSCSEVQAEPAAAGGFALLELFTSEGCSSCPPADALLAQLTREAAVAKEPVYALSFHVDYWDDLGWRDPFSRSDASSRQRAYAAALADRRVYTPQLVVNGRRAFVGSNAAQARSSIRDALAHKPGQHIAVQARVEGDRLHVRLDLSGACSPRAVLNLAIVQNQTRSRVTRGENVGRELEHVNVVSEFRSLSADQLASGEASLPLPEAGPRGHTLIAFLQDLPSMAILAATSTPLGERSQM